MLRSSLRGAGAAHDIVSLHAPLRVLENARHAPNLEHAAEFNRILRGFLASGG